MHLKPFFLLLASLFLHNSDQLTRKTYQRTDALTGDVLTCEMCPPGTYVLSHCTTDKRTQCGHCPDGHYTEIWNYVERCRYCGVFCTEEQYEKVKCSPKYNRVCECKAGYYLNVGFCSRHTTCPPGEGVSQNGTAYTDVQCTPCSKGYYSAEHSSSEGCQKHSQCAHGERAIPGDRRHDTFCTTCKNTTTDEDRSVCDSAVIDFVVQYALHPRALRRLKNTIRKAGKESSDLRHQLTSLQRRHRHRPFANVMLEVLGRARLHRLRRKVQRWFLDI
ncbi:tumor necrosis factor receptor superfamily member 6B-like [Megalops cyprinoides]|uniref:tumor necrosis factor receptor superfamily member 6B-like n=1 Tax=Megalops cyprinoides TaxID=118141 RepID=UPI00186541D6|nr:tumor necrosis factor receptor superfamily member 6B-like [Megalops cyprinoides]